MTELHPGTLAEAENFPGATLIRCDEATRENADAAGDPLVWLVTGDTFAAGYGDLDNREITVGIYARLHDAVTEVARRILMAAGTPRGWASTDGTQMIYNPTFTELPVRGWSK